MLTPAWEEITYSVEKTADYSKEWYGDEHRGHRTLGRKPADKWLNESSGGLVLMPIWAWSLELFPSLRKVIVHDIWVGEMLYYTDASCGQLLCRFIEECPVRLDLTLILHCDAYYPEVAAAAMQHVDTLKLTLIPNDSPSPQALYHKKWSEHWVGREAVVAHFKTVREIMLLRTRQQASSRSAASVTSRMIIRDSTDSSSEDFLPNAIEIPDTTCLMPYQRCVDDTDQ
jgi:hypothetical protein